MDDFIQMVRLAGADYQLSRLLQPKPSQSFLSLPSEIRIKTYGYLLPPHSQLPDYAGIRGSCKLICAEFDGEASKSVQEEFDMFTLHLKRRNIWVQSSLIDMFNTRTLYLNMSENFFSHALAFQLDIIPFKWSWLQNVTITIRSEQRASLSIYGNWGFWVGGLRAVLLGQPVAVQRIRVSNIREITISWDDEMVRALTEQGNPCLRTWKDSLFWSLYRLRHYRCRWYIRTFHVPGDPLYRCHEIVFHRREARHLWKAGLGFGAMALFVLCLLGWGVWTVSVLALGRVLALHSRLASSAPS